MRLHARSSLIAVILLLVLAGGRAPSTQVQPRNVIIFVADGFRHGSVNERDTPAFWRVRTEGVDFENSHSHFPTFTMANASAIATGHGLGDTGMFSNTIWVGYAAYDTGNFGLRSGTPTPFTENDQMLSDLHSHFDGNAFGEQTLLDLAAEHGYNTATVGKLGPTAFQTPAASAAINGAFPPPSGTIVVDDTTGAPNGVGLPPRLLSVLAREGIPPEAPTRSNGYGPTSSYNNGNAGNYARAGTLAANVVQQQWFTDVITRGLLPLFESEAKPFALLYWSRDPDGTQHNHGDSLGTTAPGINGPSSRQGVQNADRQLGQLLEWLDAHPAVRANTDVFVTSDHGFATISRREIDRTGRVTTSAAATHAYVDGTGAPDTARGSLPVGFLAIDLTLDLQLNLFDPDRRAESGASPFRRIRLASDVWEHPNTGNGLIGADVLKVDGSDATAIVAANGGSDLIYVPSGNADVVKQITELVLGYDYVGAVFVNDKYGEIPGTLPLSAIGLIGSTRLPQPAIVVPFKVFYLDPSDLLSGVQISDAGLQTGQGMHGGFGRESTFNNMAAIGPDFRVGFVDPLPVANSDIAATLARLMGLNPQHNGALRGRVLEEALADYAGSPRVAVTASELRSSPARGRQVLMKYQELEGVRYLDSACTVETNTSVCQ